jgi:hypothetical protein
MAATIWTKSRSAPDLVGELVNGEIREYEIHPEDFGLQMIASRNLKVADAAESKAKMMEALRGEPGAAFDIVALNAATALYAAGVASSIEDGLCARAKRSLPAPRSRRSNSSCRSPRRWASTTKRHARTSHTYSGIHHVRHSE